MVHEPDSSISQLVIILFKAHAGAPSVLFSVGYSGVYSTRQAGRTGFGLWISITHLTTMVMRADDR